MTEEPDGPRDDLLPRSALWRAASALFRYPRPEGAAEVSGRELWESAERSAKALDDPRNGHNYDNFMLPSVHGNFALGVNLAGGGKGPVNVFLGTDKRPVARPEVMEGLNAPQGWYQEAIGLDKRLFLIPDAKVLVTLPRTNDEVVLYRFDLDEALEKSGLDYLLVTSQPPREARPPFRDDR